MGTVSAAGIAAMAVSLALELGLPAVGLVMAAFTYTAYSREGAENA